MLDHVDIGLLLDKESAYRVASPWGLGLGMNTKDGGSGVGS